MARLYLLNFMLLCLWAVAIISLGLCVFWVVLSDAPSRQILSVISLLTFTVAIGFLAIYEASNDSLQ